MKRFSLWFLLFCLINITQQIQAEERDVRVPKGVYVPFFRDLGEVETEVGPLLVDRYPVTNEEFYSFVKGNPKWSKTAIPKIFSSAQYLNHWKSEKNLDPAIAQLPVTNLSWYAARAYCASRGRRLMTVAEWEYASDAQNPANLQMILDWYAKPASSLENVAKAKANKYGVRGMHGFIWEWVEDYSSVIIAGDSRDSNDTSKSLFCGAGSLRAKDPAQYATFMRFAHRSSLKANYVGESLGFRCAKVVGE